jgi:type IV pilus assembly protein PilC
MPYFFCRLAAEDGSVISRSFLASSFDECRKHFEQQGLCILSIKKDWKKIRIPAFPFEKKIKDRDFIMFNQELVALIRAGYPVLKSIEVIAARVKNIYLKELLMKVENEIRGGKPLSEAFVPFERNFSPVYTASLMAGERSGNLAGTISRYIDYARVVSRTKSRIKSAVTYPILLFLFSFLLLGILVNFILPRFSSFYADFESELPAITRALMSFSLAVREHILILVVLVFLFFLIYSQLKKKEETLVFKDRLKIKIPYGGSIWLEGGIALFSRTLGLLLEAGISLLASIGVSIKAVPNRFLIQRMKNLPEHIKNGESLSDSLSKTGVFPILSLDMIRIGETSANLEGMLRDVADFYDERIQTKIDTFVSLIQPVIIIFMGLVVAGMLLSVYLPIFNIIRVIQ